MPIDLNDPGVVTPQQPNPVIPEDTIINNAPINGLSVTEINDPDTIITTVSDTLTPVVVLFGARTSGKTMTLIRLTRFLEKQGYRVEPDTLFRPASDTHYKRMCSEFGRIVHSDYAAEGNDVMSFMLVKVISPQGRTLCQILEAPGEHYFDAEIPDRDFPSYIKRICTLPNRKTWMFIVEENWGGSQEVRNFYARKIQLMQRLIRPADKLIFTCHKIDKSNHYLPNGRPNENQIFINIKQQYPGIFDNYKNSNPITSIINPWRFDFVTFSAGSFNATAEGRQIYNAGEDFHPERLWKAIKKNI